MFRLHIAGLLACACLRIAVAFGRERWIRCRVDLARPRYLRVNFRTRLGLSDYYENNYLILMVFVISQTVWLQKMKICYHCVDFTLPQLLFPLSDHCSSSSSSFRPPGFPATRTAAEAAATATQEPPPATFPKHQTPLL